MSYSYTGFSCYVKAPVEALDWLERKLSGPLAYDAQCDQTNENPVNDDDEEDDAELEGLCEFQRMDDRTLLWVHGNEDSDLDGLVEAVCEMQVKFQLTGAWTLAWADSCTEPDIEAFGGGAVVCHKGVASWMHTDDWIRERIESLKKEEDSPDQRTEPSS